MASAHAEAEVELRRAAVESLRRSYWPWQVQLSAARNAHPGAYALVVFLTIAWFFLVLDVLWGPRVLGFEEVPEFTLPFGAVALYLIASVAGYDLSLQIAKWNFESNL